MIEKRQLGLLTRDAPVVIRADGSPAVDKEARTIELAFSSEYPVKRWGDTEILGHDEGEIDLSRIADGRAPFLRDHWREEQLGVIQEARVDPDRVGRAVVRLGKGDDRDRELEDFADGIRSQTSVGYRINRMVLVESSEEDGDVYRAVDWTPLEISSVAIAADPTVGAGRSGLDIPETIFERPEPEAGSREGDEMAATGNDPTAEEIQIRRVQILDDRATPTDEEIATHREQVLEREAARVADINAIAEAWVAQEDGRQAIQKGWSVERFKAHVLDTRIQAGQPITRPATELGMGDREAANFSILRAVQAFMDKDWSKAGLELEASQAVEEKLGRKARGFYVPYDVIVRPDAHMVRSALDRDPLVAELLRAAIAKGGSGANIIATDLLAGSFIDLLRARARVVQLGATVIPGLVGDISIPRQTGAATAAWVAEGAGTGDTPQTFDTVDLAALTVRARADVTRKMLLQSTPAVEALVRGDLTAVLALAIDLAAINGAGTGAEPEGILQTTGIGAGTGGYTWAGIVDLESEVAQDNADLGALAYLTSAKGRGKLKTTEKATNTAQFIWAGKGTQGDFGEMNGYNAAASNQVPDNLGGGTNETPVIFGNWGDLLIGEWGVLDLKPDEVTLGDSGGLVLRAFQDVDVDVRHPQSFSALQAII